MSKHLRDQVSGALYNTQRHSRVEAKTNVLHLRRKQRGKLNNPEESLLSLQCCEPWMYLRQNV